METLNFSIFTGAAPTLRFSLLVPEDVTDWHTWFYLKDARTGNTVWSIAGVVADLTQVPLAASLGVFDVPLTANLTASWGVKTYKYSFWRTDVGFEDPLASGIIQLKQAD